MPPAAEGELLKMPWVCAELLPPGLLWKRTE